MTPSDTMTITHVDRALAGETVELWAPPLSFKASTPRYDWLWLGYLLSPLSVPLVSGTGLFLFHLTWRMYRKALHSF